MECNTLGKMVEVGERSGMLVCVGHDRHWVICDCECGERVKILTSLFLSGKRRSCGCGVQFRNYSEGEVKND